MIKLTRGFTLIEVLIAVLIIGILAAVVLPQYQRAVLKSRFASLMPIAKSLANSNEAYYLEHGIYADNAEDLPIQGRMNYPDGTEIEFGTTTDYAYVLASNPSVENNTYVVYQKHSKNFADDTHCEALTTDDLANQVCQSFGGTPLEGSLGGADYTAYLLSGNSNGTFEKECTEPLVTEKACPSGCGVMTRESAACNTATGKWDPDDGFDEDDCPKPLGTDSKDCDPGYTGQQTREGNVCQNGTYTYGGWTNNCQAIPCYKATTCNNGVATACEAGFYLQNGSCKSCGTEATACSADGKPTACQDGYYTYPYGKPTQCQPCYTGELTCGWSSGGSRIPFSCQSGYYLSGSGAYRSCVKCGNHVVSCTSTSVVCEDGYYSSTSPKSCDGVCSNLGAGILTCSSTDAITCVSGYCRRSTNVGGHEHYRCLPC